MCCPIYRVRSDRLSINYLSGHIEVVQDIHKSLKDRACESHQIDYILPVTWSCCAVMFNNCAHQIQTDHAHARTVLIIQNKRPYLAARSGYLHHAMLYSRQYSGCAIIDAIESH